MKLFLGNKNELFIFITFLFLFVMFYFNTRLQRYVKKNRRRNFKTARARTWNISGLLSSSQSSKSKNKSNKEYSNHSSKTTYVSLKPPNNGKKRIRLKKRRG